MNAAALVRHIAATGMAGIITGVLVGGIGGRIIMRISALAAQERFGFLTENGNRIGEITAEGTMGLIVFVGIFSGGAGAVLYLSAERWLRWGGRWRGLLFGFFLLAIGGGASSALDPDNFDFVVLGHPALNIGMFGGLFLIFGAVIVKLDELLERRLPRSDGFWSPATLGYGLLLLPGGMFVVGLPFLLLSTEACGCAPSIAAWAVLALAVATLGSWTYWLRGRVEPKWLVAVGYTLAGVAVALGGIRLYRDIAEIIMAGS